MIQAPRKNTGASVPSSGHQPETFFSSAIPSLTFLIGLCLVAFAIFMMELDGQSVANSHAKQDKVAEKKRQDKPRLAERQKSIENRFKSLQEMMFNLSEFEKSTNPDRAKLLEQVYRESQARTVLNKIIAARSDLSNENLKSAIDNQSLVLSDLQTLLKLLENEDRGRRIQNDKERIRRYILEVDRLIKIEQGIRGQTEGGVDAQRVAKAQSRAIERAKKLSKSMKDHEESQKIPGEEEPSTKTGKDGDSKDGDSKAGKSKDDPSKSDPSKDDPSKGNPSKSGKSKDKNSEDQKGSKGVSPDGSKKSGSPKNGKSGSPKSPPKNGKQNQPEGKGAEGKGAEGKDQPQNPPKENPEQNARQRIEAAQKRMQKAQQDLEKSDRQESRLEIRKAEIELAKAKEELQRILRQLREKEVERSLAMLESRFRRMLERQLRIYESTKRLDSTKENDRGSEFDIRAGKLGIEQRNLASDAGRALLLLEEDGSSIAFPETVRQVRDDMNQVAGRLGASKLGKMTLGIEEDIIDSLDDLIAALVQAQKDNEEKKEKSEPEKGEGEPGETALVDSIAELKMIRGLQIRINKRHKRYSNFLKNPDDPVGFSSDPEVQGALERLSQRQTKVQQITRDLVLGKNK